MKQFVSWKTLSLVLAATLVMVGVIVPTLASPRAQQGSSPNTITVSGEGLAYGAPDVAYIQMGVEMADTDLGKVITQSNQSMSKVIEALKTAGVKAEDLQTSGFNMWVEQRNDPQSNAPLSPLYHVQNIVNVTVRDVTQVSAIIDAGVAAGANNVYGLSFGIADTSGLEQQARAKAVANAKVRAEQLAQLNGVTLGNPLAISEAYGGGIPTYNATTFGKGGGGGGVPVQQGQLSVGISVTITYSISQ